MTTPTLTNQNVIAFERTGETRAPKRGESVSLDGKVFTLESDSVIACEILTPIPNAWVIIDVPGAARVVCFVERIPQPGLRELSPEGHPWSYPKVWPAGTVAICCDGKMLLPSTHDTCIVESTIVYDIIAPEPAVASEPKEQNSDVMSVVYDGDEWATLSCDANTEHDCHDNFVIIIPKSAFIRGSQPPADERREKERQGALHQFRHTTFGIIGRTPNAVETAAFLTGYDAAAKEKR